MRYSEIPEEASENAEEAREILERIEIIVGDACDIILAIFAAIGILLLMYIVFYIWEGTSGRR